MMPYWAFQNLVEKLLYEQTRLKPGKSQAIALFEGDNKLKCVGCKMCEVACPAEAISLDVIVESSGRPYPSRFDVDMTKCISCGLCSDACPVDAIGLVAAPLPMAEEREKLYHGKERLILNGRGTDKER